MRAGPIDKLNSASLADSNTRTLTHTQTHTKFSAPGNEFSRSAEQFRTPSYHPETEMKATFHFSLSTFACGTSIKGGGFFFH